jgi:hypothetical protein
MIVKFCVFLGREKNMKILHSYIELSLINNVINEYHMYDFSRNINDHNFILLEYNRLKSIYINKIYLYNFYKGVQFVKTNWNPFYKQIATNSADDDIIIKCDDDILFIDVYSLKDAIIDRYNDKESFLIHSNCINNGVCAYYQRHLFPKIQNELNTFPKGGIMGILFENPIIAYSMHNQFYTDILNNIENLNKYIIDDIYINNRISINFILINGRDAKYLSDVSYSDEYELSSFIPEQLLRPNKIKGNLITSHLSYTFQEKILLNNNEILNNYLKIKNNYMLSKKPVIYKNNIFNKITFHKNIVKNWINDYSFYIKNIETNKYLYIDYDIDELCLSETDKTIFEIKNNTINLGIYYLTKYNYIGKFRNENMLLKYFKDYYEKEIIKENIDENNTFYLKFTKCNKYLSVNHKNDKLLDINTNKINKWIFEKINNNSEYITVSRFIKNNKIYYQNIDTKEIYANYYNGWSL